MFFCLCYLSAVRLHDVSFSRIRECKAPFIRRTFHEPNLTIWFGACKDRRMNQLGSTDMYLGRPAVLFDCASRIERQKFDFDSDVKLLYVPNHRNAYVTCDYINYIYPRGLRVPSTWHGGKRGMCLSLGP